MLGIVVGSKGIEYLALLQNRTAFLRTAACLLVLIPACGGESEGVKHRSEGEPVPTDGAIADEREEGEPSAGTADGVEDDDAAADTAEEDPFEDEPCEKVPPPVSEMGCDPFDPDSGCSSGQGCKPFVEYPTSPCEPERFGARCDWVGTGVQGDPCSAEPCAAGFLCIATGQGTQCAQLCALDGSAQCPQGLVCASVDIEGLGTCF